MSLSDLPSIIFVPYATPGHLLAAGIVFPIVGILTVVLRFYVRVEKRQKMGWDDWFIIPALVRHVLRCVKKHAFGYPTPPPEPGEHRMTAINPELQIVQQIEFAITILIVLAYGFIKLSILFFYRRLFVTERKGGILNTLAWILVAIIIAWMLTFIFLTIWGCGTHYTANWGSLQDLITYCSNGLQREEALYVSEFVTNILLVALPIPTVWRLHMHWKKKLAVTGVLLLAFMALIASIIRLAIVLQVTTTSYHVVTDENLTIATIYYWSMIEAGLALIACSLPSLKPLVSEVGLQSAINSVRSALSLNSMGGGSSGSKNSRGSRNSRTNTYGRLEDRNQDGVPLRSDEIMEMHATASHVTPPKRAFVSEGIRVQRDVDITGSQA
ncbi:hypothetical protein HYFRA_00003079 [Hymenoscyphus fraxineus]|uniref:Rhodopsin domain-containing protein n=1 Tax=Hymenoscyphus fraxineus TaxID=746836 RepID=A0A9N9KSN3_9HELO|nr:hypothetical protein HYFRA_00003079 [Hymenoscyphus fraxineus]